MPCHIWLDKLLGNCYTQGVQDVQNGFAELWEIYKINTIKINFSTLVGWKFVIRSILVIPIFIHLGAIFNSSLSFTFCFVISQFECPCIGC